jgi:hypothetical protein
MSLSIQKRRVGADVVVLGLAGRINLGLECQEVEWQVEDLLKEHEKKIILDFSELKCRHSPGVYGYHPAQSQGHIKAATMARAVQNAIRNQRFCLGVME